MVFFLFWIPTLSNTPHDAGLTYDEHSGAWVRRRDKGSLTNCQRALAIDGG